MSISQPFFFMMNEIFKQEETSMAFNIPLKEIEYSHDKLQQLLSFLWTAECDLFASQDFQ